MNYYSIPLKANEVIRGKNLANEMETRLSIHQNIRLMINALTLSYRFDPSYGCILNKYNARTPPQRKLERSWREEIRNDIQNNIKYLLQCYETRIQVQDVIVALQEPDKNDHRPTVKVRVDISGQLTLGRKERFHYPDSEIAEEAQEVFPILIPVGKW
jgi:predicted component of type VI protein secretion system